MLLCGGDFVIFAPTDIRCVKAPIIRVGAQDNSFFVHHRLIWTHKGWRRRFGVVNPSVVDGHRGVGVAIVRCFFVLRWFKNYLRHRRSGEAYGTGSIVTCNTTTSHVTFNAFTVTKRDLKFKLFALNQHNNFECKKLNCT
jgi:hypothetical protein